MSTKGETYALIVEAVKSGARCPIREALSPLFVGRLVAEGKIRVEVYRHNWRVITLLDGPLKGKSTAPCPVGGEPYYVSGRGRKDRGGRSIDVGSPSAPRDYSGGT